MNRQYIIENNVIWQVLTVSFYYKSYSNMNSINNIGQTPAGLVSSR